VTSGSFDATGAVFLTQLPDRVEAWDAATGERRGSYAGVQATSPDRRYLVFESQVGTPAVALRLIDVARGTTVLSIPLGRYYPRARFSADSRFLVLGAERVLRSTAEEPTLDIVDLSAARVVARVRGGWQWAIGPAGKALFVGDAAGTRPGLYAYDLATGRPIGELTTARPALSDTATRHLASWIGPDDRRIAVPVLEGTGPTARLKFLVWQSGRPDTVSIDSSWADTFDGVTTSFNADGTRLLISGSQQRATSPPQPRPTPAPFQMAERRPVVELWDLAGPRRLMSTADSAPELIISNPRLLVDPRQGAFATFHDPTKNPDGTGAILWEMETGKALGRYRGAMGPQSLDGGYLQVNNNSTGNPMLISARTGEVRRVPGVSPFHVGPAPGRRIAVTQRPKSVALTDLETGRAVADLAGQTILRGASSADGKRLATRGVPGLNVWEVETGTLLRSASLVGGPLSDVHFSPDGRRLAFNVNDRFRALDIESDRLVAIDRPGHRAAIRALDFSRDGALIASAGDDAAICLWEAATGRFAAMLEELTEPIAALAFGVDGRSLVARAATGRVQAWRLDRSEAGGRIAVVATPTWEFPAPGASAGPVAVARSGLVALGAADGTIALRDAGTGCVERTLKPEAGWAHVVALAARPDDGRLAAADAEGVVRLWDPSADRPTLRLATGQGAIRAMALGRNVLAVAGDSLELWGAEGGEPILTLEANARNVHSLEFSPDGRILAVTDDKKAALRDLDEIRRLMAELDLGW
jgi:WD40 repeat protein